MILFIRLFKESALFAWGSVVSNKLRTFLTLLGITIGIFAIISVFSVVDALEKQIRTSIASLGDNVIYIQKWPWEFSSEYPWWKYVNRPSPRPSEMDELMRRTDVIEVIAYKASTRRTVEYKSKSIENITIISASHDFEKVQTFGIGTGRYFSPTESFAGRNIAIIGSKVATNLFDREDPIGKNIKIFGRNIEVVGTFAVTGENSFGENNDEMVLLPLSYISSFLDVSNDYYSPEIIAKGKAGFTNEELMDELTGAMRSIRRIKPSAEDNFALNRASLISKQFDGLFAILKMAGWIIGGFSILVGGFGIANIMFVSVKERTTIIGIQKALGAKNYFILLQFLAEAVFLSLMGGAIGLLFVFGGTWIASKAFDMDLLLSIENLMLGVNVSIIIGVVAGFIPAWSASQLNPVDAIRANT